MTPDTAALRELAEDALAAAYSVSVSLHPDTVRALCDAADEVERLRAGREDDRYKAAVAVLNEQLRTSAAKRRAEDAEAKLDASRTAHAALVADLRATIGRHLTPRDEWSRCTDDECRFECENGCGHDDCAVRDAFIAIAALLDRHTPTTEETP